MKTFKQFISESKKQGNYVSINVKTSIEIKSLGSIFGESSVCNPGDQHVTLIYSEGTNVDKGVITKLLRNYEGDLDVTTNGAAAFDSLPKDGERDEKLCTIVVKLKSGILDEIHEKLKKIGLNHSYPEFSPHVSLLYNIPIDQKQKAIDIVSKFLKADMSTVTLAKFNINPIIKDWHEKVKNGN